MIRLLFAACAALSLACPAAARMYYWITPNDLHALLADRVDSLSVDTSGGDTTLEGVVDGHRFSVFFYECDGGNLSSVATPDSHCLGYEFRAYIADAPKDDATLQRWNAENHYGKLWRDADDDLSVHYTSVVEGGVEDDHILTALAWWRAILKSVDDFYAPT